MGPGSERWAKSWATCNDPHSVVRFTLVLLAPSARRFGTRRFRTVPLGLSGMSLRLVARPGAVRGLAVRGRRGSPVRRFVFRRGSAVESPRSRFRLIRAGAMGGCRARVGGHNVVRPASSRIGAVTAGGRVCVGRIPCVERFRIDGAAGTCRMDHPQPLNSPGLPVAATPGTPWFTDANCERSPCAATSCCC